MQKLGLSQIQTQKLSPQQIQFIKLLQVPTAELETRIEEEMEMNPALEEGREEPEENSDADFEEKEKEEKDDKDEIDLDDYLRDDDYAGYKMQGDRGGDEEERDMPLAGGTTLNDMLRTQLNFLKLDDEQRIIGLQLIGSIDHDGYIRRDLDSIINDMAFAQNVHVTLKEVEEVLSKVQRFDPSGIGARSLQECLLIQLRNKDTHSEAIELAIVVVNEHFTEFTKKHYQKIIRRLGITEEDLKHAIEVITRLNPKPGGSTPSGAASQYLMPDFILVNNNGKLELSLNSRNAPELRISRSYSEMMQAYDKGSKEDKKLKDAVTFVKQKLDSAKWFIDAIKQRQNTLLRTMNTIVEYQYNYFLEGDESALRPMILKDIAERISMDISTVSRVANSKSVQTEFGIIPLKYFFSEGIATEDGEDVSSREVKHVLKTIIEAEDKRKPLSDDKLEKMLKENGYSIARRTVAKYREQMHIPVARLRKEL